MNKQENYIKLSHNMRKALERKMCNIQINLNSTDALNGYGCIIHESFVYSEYAEWCTRPSCYYHSIYRPNERGEKCNRHCIQRGYEDLICAQDYDEFDLKLGKYLEEEHK